MTIFKERVEPTFTTAGVNALIVEQYDETFYDIFEIVICGNKYIAEKSGEINNTPIVKIPIVYNGERVERPFLLYKGKFEVIFNPEVSEIRSEYTASESETVVVENTQQDTTVSDIINKCRALTSKYEEVVKVDESVADYINKNTSTIYEELDKVKQVLLNEFISIADQLHQQTDKQIIDQFADTYNKLRSELENNAKLFQQHINVEAGELYKNLQAELYAEIEKIYKSKVYTHLIEEFNKQQIELSEKQVVINNELQTGLAAIRSNTNVYIDNILQEQDNKLSNILKITKQHLISKFDSKISKATKEQDSNVKKLVEESKELLSNQIKSEVSNTQLKLQQILTETVNSNTKPSAIDLTDIQKQLEKNIEDRFNSELTNIKRYVSLMSGGGSGSARTAGGGSGSTFWGDIGGDISSQSDLTTALNLIRSDITSIQNSVNSNLSSINSLQTSVSSLQTSVSSLQISAANFKQDITSIQQSITSLPSSSSNGSLTITIGDGVNVIRENTFSYLIMPYSCQLNSWRIIADTVGTLTVDIKKSNYTLFPSTTSIVNSNYINLTDQQTNTSVITGWTVTSLLSTDVIHCVVNTASNIRKATISINLTK